MVYLVWKTRRYNSDLLAIYATREEAEVIAMEVAYHFWDIDPAEPLEKRDDVNWRDKAHPFLVWWGNDRDNVAIEEWEVF